MEAGPCKPDIRQLVEVDRERQHAEPRRRRDEQPAPGDRPAHGFARIGHPDRQQPERHAEEAPVRPGEPREKSPGKRAAVLVTAEVVPRAGRRQQEHRLGVGRAVEHRKGVRGEQEDGAARLGAFHERARDAREIPAGPEECDPGDRDAAPGQPCQHPLLGQPGAERAGKDARRAHRHRVRRKEREVLLAVVASLPVVPVRGNARIPLRVPPGGQRPDCIARDRLLRRRGRDTERRDGEKAHGQHGRPCEPERRERIHQRRTTPQPSPCVHRRVPY